MMNVRRTRGSRVRGADRRRQGAALAEYGLLLAGLTLASMVAVSVLGGKVGGIGTYCESWSRNYASFWDAAARVFG